MNENKKNLFTCDILICGTSFLNTLLATYFSLKNYKVINIDKNNFYGDVNASLNFSQFKNEKAKYSKFWEDYVPFSTETEQNKELLKEVLKKYLHCNSNKFNIDINPKILYNESNIVDLLVGSKAHTYVTFVGLQNFCLTYKEKTKKTIKEENENENTLVQVKVPLNKSQIFLDKSLNLVEKRTIMNFMSKNIVYDKHYTFSNYSNHVFLKKADPSNKKDQEPNKKEKQKIVVNQVDKIINNLNGIQDECIDNEEDEEMNIIEYLSKFKFTDKLNDYLIYGIGLFDLPLHNKQPINIPEFYLSGFSENPTKYTFSKKEILKRLYTFINSLSKFKSQNVLENAFIYPSYGLNDIIYALTRIACLNNCTYMINRSIKKIICSDNISNTQEKNPQKNKTIEGRIQQVLLDNGFIIKAKMFIFNNSNADFTNTWKKYVLDETQQNYESVRIKTHRLCVISTYSLLGASGVSYYIHKNKNTHKQEHTTTTTTTNNNNEKEEEEEEEEEVSIHILQLDKTSGSCPAGLFLTYFTFLEILNNANITNENNSINGQPKNCTLLLETVKLFIQKNKKKNQEYSIDASFNELKESNSLQNIKKYLNDMTMDDKTAHKELEKILINEGILYCAYFEYEPTVYRKDVIDMLKQNEQNYRDIFNDLKKEKKQRKENKQEYQKSTEENINETESTSDRNTTILQIGKSTKIQNVLFTNDIHNYPIYPFVEEIAMFTFIISKIYKKKEKYKIQSIYDIVNMKDFFSYQAN